MSDIEQRLREAHPISQQYANGSKILLEAADEITRLQADNEALRARVAELVEALENIAGTFHHSASAGEYFAKVARAALATHRKGDDAP